MRRAIIIAATAAVLSACGGSASTAASNGDAAWCRAVFGQGTTGALARAQVAGVHKKYKLSDKFAADVATWVIIGGPGQQAVQADCTALGAPAG
jgi:hypothetical protein